MIQGLLIPEQREKVTTEGIKYAGSKRKLLGDIIDMLIPLHPKRVWDAFSGTTRVSQAIAQMGYDVIASDISVWSQCFATCYLLNRHPESYYADLFEHLNHLRPVEGWYSEHYGADPTEKNAQLKRPWQLKNTQKLDAIRREIDRLHLPYIEKCVALTGLILALDKVDNTLGHYVSYLRDWAPRTYNDLYLEVPNLFPNHGAHEVLRGDIFSFLPDVCADIAYLDPPYGSNNEKMPPSRIRYSSYYHIWTTIILNDHPKLFGKANRRVDSADTRSASVFEEFRTNPSTGKFLALEAIDRLLRDIQTDYILLSYSTSGRATFEQLMDSLASHGSVLQSKAIDYKRHVMSEMKWTNTWVNHLQTENKELLFLLKK